MAASVSLACAGFVKSLHERAAIGDEMKVAVHGVIRPQAAVGSMYIRYVMAGNLDGFLFRVSVLALGVLALAAQVVAEQEVVVRLEQNAHGRPIAEIEIEADDGDVLDHGRPHHAGQLRLAHSDLLLEPFADVAIDAVHDQHVAQVALPVAHEVAEPEVVRKIAEPHVETFLRHMRSERFDRCVRLSSGGRRIDVLLRGVCRSRSASAERRTSWQRNHHRVIVTA